MVISGGICACLLIMVVCWCLLVIYWCFDCAFRFGLPGLFVGACVLLLCLDFVRSCDFCRWLGCLFCVGSGNAVWLCGFVLWLLRHVVLLGSVSVCLLFV